MISPGPRCPFPRVVKLFILAPLKLDFFTYTFNVPLVCSLSIFCAKMFFLFCDSRPFQPFAIHNKLPILPAFTTTAAIFYSSSVSWTFFVELLVLSGPYAKPLSTTGAETKMLSEHIIVPGNEWVRGHFSGFDFQFVPGRAALPHKSESIISATSGTLQERIL